MNNSLNNLLTKYLTITRGSAKIFETREIKASSIREIKEQKTMKTNLNLKRFRQTLGLNGKADNLQTVESNYLITPKGVIKIC